MIDRIAQASLGFPAVCPELSPAIVHLDPLRKHFQAKISKIIKPLIHKSAFAAFLAVRIDRTFTAAIPLELRRPDVGSIIHILKRSRPIISMSVVRSFVNGWTTTDRMHTVGWSP
jgi:hypothetical protein